MKYKVGDEVLLKAEISEVRENAFPGLPYTVLVRSGKQCKGVEIRCATLRDINEDVIADMTAEEAWEIAHRICNMDGDLRTQILGDRYYHMAEVCEDFTPQQVKAKIEAWEEKEIKVGDIVRSAGGPDIEVLITRRYQDEDCYSGVGPSGKVYSDMRNKYWKKTGRHIDIQGLLEQIGGAE